MTSRSLAAVTPPWKRHVPDEFGKSVTSSTAVTPARVEDHAGPPMANAEDQVRLDSEVVEALGDQN